MYVPVGLDLDKIKHGDEAKWMIHLIYIFTKLHWQREEWPFIHLKFDYLAHVIDKDVIVSLREWLVSKGIIECDGHYVKGHKAFGFRLTSKYHGQPHHQVEINNSVVKRAIIRHRTNEIVTAARP